MRRQSQARLGNGKAERGYGRRGDGFDVTGVAVARRGKAGPSRAQARLGQALHRRSIGAQRKRRQRQARLGAAKEAAARRNLSVTCG